MQKDTAPPLEGAVGCDNVQTVRRAQGDANFCISGAPIAVQDGQDVIAEVFAHGMRYVRRRLRY